MGEIIDVDFDKKTVIFKFTYQAAIKKKALERIDNKLQEIECMLYSIANPVIVRKYKDLFEKVSDQLQKDVNF